jgi:hypothetical protein
MKVALCCQVGDVTMVTTSGDMGASGFRVVALLEAGSNRVS